jgi:transcriptional regulator with XRE-family HTH domain
MPLGWTVADARAIGRREGTAVTFAERLRELRDAAGLSEARLAELSGVGFASVHEYGLGRRKPSLAAAVKLARALGVDCTAFADCDDVGGSPEPPAARPAKEKPKQRPKGRS